jgi:hypothetical protein
MLTFMEAEIALAWFCRSGRSGLRSSLMPPPPKSDASPHQAAPKIEPGPTPAPGSPVEAPRKPVERRDAPEAPQGAAKPSEALPRASGTPVSWARLLWLAAGSLARPGRLRLAARRAPFRGTPWDRGAKGGGKSGGK